MPRSHLSSEIKARLDLAKAELAEVQLASARAKLIALEADLPQPTPEYMSYEDLPPPSPEEAAHFRKIFDKMVEVKTKERLNAMIEALDAGSLSDVAPTADVQAIRALLFSWVSSNRDGSVVPSGRAIRS